LMLSQLLAARGIDTVVLERHSRDYVESRIRAGVLEHQSAAALRAAGVGARMDAQGMAHSSIDLAFAGAHHRIDLEGLTGKKIMVYGQHEVVKDLIAQRLADGGDIRFEAEVNAIEGLDGDQPKVRYTHNGQPHELVCDFIAGCDGYHGVSRTSVPSNALKVYEHRYPYAWLGVLAEAAPTSDELVYARHETGFALYSMRSPSVTRLYFQCRPDEDPEAWSDAALWAELHRRLETGDGWTINEGPILQKNVAPMRSFVVEPMRYQRLFLAGDAAHIVPPTGAKGMNLALADVQVLAPALVRWFEAGDPRGLDSYSEVCLKRVWRVQRFSVWMTRMLHAQPDADAFEERLQQAELASAAACESAARHLAENYVGLPLEAPAT
ncbi:4-hydroxybenzoate 3-monooxygenase, partial [Rhodobaculum claviforme]|nr:4-hydroxybenzoate 3-monooxygenase [Rhodobaculum claviforme]